MSWQKGFNPHDYSMNTRQRNSEQIKMALGDVNRYYFAEHYGRSAKEGKEGEDELLIYFITYGSGIYAATHEDAKEGE